MEGLLAREAEKPNDFEKQFAKREWIPTAGGMAEVVDISPEHPKSEVPVLLVPGYATSINVYKNAIEVLARDRRTIAFSQPRLGGKKLEIPEHLAQYPAEDVLRAQNILGILEYKGIAKTDVVGHSEGAVNASIATLESERVRNLVLDSPPGVIGNDNLKRLFGGFIGQFTKGKPSLEELPVSDEDRTWAEEKGHEVIEYPAIKMKHPVRMLRTVVTEGAKYALKNPARTVREGLGLANVDITGLLEYLHTEKKVGIVIIAHVDDPLFPIERVSTMLKTNMLDGFLSVRGGHGQIAENAEEFTFAAAQMLTALEEKQKKAALDPIHRAQGEEVEVHTGKD